MHIDNDLIFFYMVVLDERGARATALALAATLIAPQNVQFVQSVASQPFRTANRTMLFVRKLHAKCYRSSRSSRSSRSVGLRAWHAHSSRTARAQLAHTRRTSGARLACLVPAGLPACRPAGLRARCSDRGGREGRAPGVSVTAPSTNNFFIF